MDILSKRLRELRESQELNQTEVADAIHVSQSSYSGYERGTVPSLETIIEIAKFFNVSIDYIVGLSSLKNLNQTNDSNNDSLAFLSKLPQQTSKAPVTEAALRKLASALTTYIAIGAPIGFAPVNITGETLSCLSNMLEATASDNLANIIDAANELTQAGLKANDIIKDFISKKEIK